MIEKHGAKFLIYNSRRPLKITRLVASQGVRTLSMMMGNGKRNRKDGEEEQNEEGKEGMKKNSMRKFALHSK